MSRSFAPAALCLAALALPAPLAAAPRVIPGFANPESVQATPAGIFVSNIGPALEPARHDGDGFLSLLDESGAVIAREAIGGLDAPKGLALLGGVLYVTDIDRVLGFDPVSRKQVFSAAAAAEGVPFLNDLAVRGDQLLVTDTARGLLLGLDPATGRFETLAEGIAGANGVVWDSARGEAVVVGLGARFEGGDAFRWRPGAGPQKIPGAPFGILDGVVPLPDGRVIVSDWVDLEGAAGRLFTLDPRTGAHAPLDPGAALHGPADIAAGPGGTLWIPAMLEGTVAIVPLP